MDNQPGDHVLERLEQIEKRYREIEEQLSDVEVMNQPQRYRELAREERALAAIIKIYRNYKKTLDDIESDKKILTESQDAELLEIAESELEELRERADHLEEEIKILLKSILNKLTKLKMLTILFIKER